MSKERERVAMNTNRGSWALFLLVGTGVILGIGLPRPGWAEDSADEKPNEVRQDRQEIRQDAAQIQKDKEVYRQQMSALEAQRAEALKSGNVDQAKALTQQIHQLREGGRERRHEDLKELRQDRRELRQDLKERWRDRDNNPPGPAGGPGTNWENPPGSPGGPGVGPDRPRPRLGERLENRGERLQNRGERVENRGERIEHRPNPPGPAGGPRGGGGGRRR